MMTNAKTNNETNNGDREARVLDALAALSGGDRIYLSRKSPTTLKYEYLGKVESGEDPAELLERVQAIHGGGEYKAQAYGDQEGGGRGFLPGAAYFDIAGPPKGPGAPAGAAPAGDPRVDRLEAMMERVLERIAEDRTGRTDELTRLLFEQQGKMMEALASRPQAEAADPSRFLEVFLQGMDMGREAGGGGESDPYDGVAARLMDLVQSVQGAEAPAALPPGPEAAPMIEPPGAAALALRPHLPQLLQAARARIPARRVAEAVLGAADPEAVDLVLVDPTVIDDVIAIEPAFTRWRSWLSDVLAELDELSDPETDDDADDGRTGDSPAPGGGADS